MAASTRASCCAIGVTAMRSERVAGDAEVLTVGPLPHRVVGRGAGGVDALRPAIRLGRRREDEVDRRAGVVRLIGRRTRRLGAVGTVPATLAVALPLRVDDQHDVTGLGQTLREPGVHLVVGLQPGGEGDGRVAAGRARRRVQTGAELRPVAVDERELEVPAPPGGRPLLGAAEGISDLRRRAGATVGVAPVRLGRPLGEGLSELGDLERHLLGGLRTEGRVGVGVGGPLVVARHVVGVAGLPLGRAGRRIPGVLVADTRLARSAAGPGSGRWRPLASPTPAAARR